MTTNPYTTLVAIKSCRGLHGRRVRGGEQFDVPPRVVKGYLKRGEARELTDEELVALAQAAAPTLISGWPLNLRPYSVDDASVLIRLCESAEYLKAWAEDEGGRARGRRTLVTLCVERVGKLEGGDNGAQ